MDVINGLLSESEFRLFTSEDYAALESLLDDSLAGQLKEYLNGTGQDAYVLDCIRHFLLPTIESLTFPKQLHEEGYVDMISKLSPQVVVSTVQDPAYLEDLHKKLRYLEANYDRITARTPTRTKADFETFACRMDNLLYRAAIENVPLTYPDLDKRLKANKFVFYSPQDKGHSTMLGTITRKHREWLLCLRGLDFKEYCDDKGVPANLRRSF